MRVLDKLLCRAAHSFITATWSPTATRLGDGDRSAATATDRASSGSFLLVDSSCIAASVTGRSTVAGSGDDAALKLPRREAEQAGGKPDVDRGLQQLERPEL